MKMEKELAKSQSREKTNKDQGRLERTVKPARTNFNEVFDKSQTEYKGDKANILHITQQKLLDNTGQKMKFSIKNFFSKCDQILRKLWIWSHLLKKSLMENIIFCAV